MQWPNVGNQQKFHNLYDASGAVAAGGTPQLILPQTPSRAMLLVENLSLHDMFIEIGGGRAAATITDGAVTSIAITNAGFNYTYPPIVYFWGGGAGGNGSNLGLGQPSGEAPNSTLGVGRPATGRAIMSGSAPNKSVASIEIDDPGQGYVCAPFIFLQSVYTDPYGVATPAAGVGIYLTPAGGSFYVNGPSCPTDAISVFSATTGSVFTCKWMT